MESIAYSNIVSALEIYQQFGFRKGCLTSSARASPASPIKIEMFGIHDTY